MWSLLQPDLLEVFSDSLDALILFGLCKKLSTWLVKVAIVG